MKSKLRCLKTVRDTMSLADRLHDFGQNPRTGKAPALAILCAADALAILPMMGHSRCCRTGSLHRCSHVETGRSVELDLINSFYSPNPHRKGNESAAPIGDQPTFQHAQIDVDQHTVSWEKHQGYKLERCLVWFVWVLRPSGNFDFMWKPREKSERIRCTVASLLPCPPLLQSAHGTLRNPSTWPTGCKLWKMQDDTCTVVQHVSNNIRSTSNWNI